MGLVGAVGTCRRGRMEEMEGKMVMCFVHIYKIEK
jgi:hypothetical protein